jgi:DNA-binding MarR family transcriptional regulator
MPSAGTDVTIATIEDSVVTIVREATLPSVQERFVEQAGVAVERAGYGVLRGVAEHGPVRVTDLARQLGVDPSTVSRQVKALERQGMLARDGDPRDGRVARLALTPAGGEALELLRVVRHRLFAEILADWAAEDRATLAPLLARLARDFVVLGGRL